MSFQPRNLVLIRHGESEANAANVFTGTSESVLTHKGEQQMRDVARELAAAGIYPDRWFLSALDRARRSVAIINEVMGARSGAVCADAALNERDYGDLTGLNKDDAVKRWGPAQVMQWRRSFETAPPGGESLRDTAARVLRYYVRTLLPDAMAGGNTFVVAHGNSLRALIMALEGWSPSEIARFQIETGAAIIYDLANDSRACRSDVILPKEHTWP